MMNSNMNTATHSSLLHAADSVIHHPVDIPLEIQAIAVDAWQQANHNTSACGELAFHFPMMIAVGAVLKVRIPTVSTQDELYGQVIWLAKSAHGFVIGMAFQSENEAFRMRMLEQLCYIENYRQQVLGNEGRHLDTQQAAAEWIEQHAAEFPPLQSRTH